MCEINKTPPVSLSAPPSHLISGRSMRVRTDVVDRHKPGIQIWNYGVGMPQGGLPFAVRLEMGLLPDTQGHSGLLS